ncbi:hypothetical protein C8J55DRAFT_486382 [Lentinula edodes]|uniref:Uncharacterized protein n=1 Tax=Lentinula lateritia TaxID=40482 RepID=A0A9W9AVD6_9AGAR|nr:hypothetical protein C8J55DRAFT_486382 [Lentinula edodes]
MLIDGWVLQGHLKAQFHYPATLENAQALRQLEAYKPPSPSVTNAPLPSEILNTSGSLPATSWMMVQAMGGDTTVLGTAFDGEAEASLDQGSESSDDGSLGEEDTDDITPHMLSQQAGITTQITHRLTQEAQALLPRLYGIDNALADIHALPHALELLEFQQVSYRIWKQTQTMQIVLFTILLEQSLLAML